MQWNGTRVLPGAFGLPDISVDRSRYGGPEALIEAERFRCFGVAEIAVADVPPSVVEIDDEYEFKVVHVPTKRNPAHSEIRAYRNGEHLSEAVQVSPEVDQRFRFMLARNARISIVPSS